MWYAQIYLYSNVIIILAIKVLNSIIYISTHLKLCVAVYSDPQLQVGENYSFV